MLSLLPASWGAGPGKRDAVGAAGPGARAGRHRLAGRRRPGRPGREADAGGPPTSAPTGIGHSALVGPDGTVRAQLGAAADLLVGDVDTEEIARVRRAVAVLDNRSL